MKARLLTACFGTVLLVVALALVGVTLNQTMAGAYGNAVTERVPQIQALAHVAVAVTRAMEEGLSGASTAVSHGDGSTKQAISPIEEALAYAQIYGDTADEAEEVERAEHLKKSIAELAMLIERIASRQVDGQQASTLLLSQTCHRVLEHVEDAIADEMEELEEDSEIVASLSDGALYSSLAASGLALLLTAAFGYVMIRSISRPLKELQGAAAQFGDERFDYRVGPQPLAEFNVLAEAFNEMAEDVQKAQQDRELAHKQLADASRLAGMAEIATGILHNIGNVLNSVNITLGKMSQRARGAKVSDLAAVSTVINEHADDLSGFIINDQRGRHLPAFLAQMSLHLQQVFTDINRDTEELLRHIKHINQIVATQQSHAKIKGIISEQDLTDLVEQALQINSVSMTRHRVLVSVDPSADRKVHTDSHKILQVMVNLISNAKNAVEKNSVDNRRIQIKIEDQGDADNARVVATFKDNGCGISPENLSRIFNHGFTTRTEGHGFGLHHAGVTVNELGGSLEVESDGLGKGATFRLTLPVIYQPNKLDGEHASTTRAA